MKTPAIRPQLVNERFLVLENRTMTSLSMNLALIKKTARNIRRRLLRIEGVADDCALMCGVASVAIVTALRKLRIRSRFVYGKFHYTSQFTGKKYQDSHCWVETNTHIIDITATQFGDFPQVFVVSKDSKFVHFHENRRTKTSLDPSHRFWTGWPEDLVPTKNLIRRLLPKRR